MRAGLVYCVLLVAAPALAEQVLPQYHPEHARLAADLTRAGGGAQAFARAKAQAEVCFGPASPEAEDLLARARSSVFGEAEQLPYMS